MPWRDRWAVMLAVVFVAACTVAGFSIPRHGLTVGLYSLGGACLVVAYLFGMAEV